MYRAYRLAIVIPAILAVMNLVLAVAASASPCLPVIGCIGE